MQSATGREAASVAADNVALSTIFVDPANDDYRLAGNSPANRTGATLPGNVAAATGLSGGVHLGAYSWPTPTGAVSPPPGTTTTTAPATTTTLPQPTTTTAPAGGTALTTPVYQLRHNTTGDRIYTTNTNERDALVSAGYTDNGIAFHAATSSNPSNTAVYRLRSSSGAHLYTTGTNERDTLVNKGWTLEGTAFYGARTKANGLTGIYRLYDSKTNDHYLSASAVVPAGSKQEAIFFYAAP